MINDEESMAHQVQNHRRSSPDLIAHFLDPNVPNSGLDPNVPNSDLDLEATLSLRDRLSLTEPVSLILIQANGNPGPRCLRYCCLWSKHCVS